MAQDFSSQEFKALRSAFSASDIDGDGFISKEDLQTSSGLDKEEDVDALFNAFKKGASGEHINFEEFTKGVMDFPFLLEQYRVELEERRSTDWPVQRRSNDDTTINIDTIEEDVSMEDCSPERQPPSPRFDSDLGTILEFPASPLVGHNSLAQAYNIYCSLVQHRGSMSWAGSLGEYRLEDYVDMIKGILERVDKKFKDQSIPAKTSEALIKATQMITDQLEKCIKAFNSALLEHIQTEDSLSDHNRELRKRCEMAETRSNLLFDRLKLLENEMEQEQIRQETILQESFRLQDLLNSAHKQGQQTSQELAEIHSEIAMKEGQINQLQQEIRRLNSRRVLREIPVTEDSAAVEVRNLRRERRTGGGSGFSARSYDQGKQSPSSPTPNASPLHSPRSLLNSPFIQTEKSRPAFRLSAHIQGQRRLLQEWEAQLKSKEQDLGLQAERQIKLLRSELSESIKLLNGQKNRVRELELALAEGAAATQDCSTSKSTLQDCSTAKSVHDSTLCFHTEQLVSIPGAKSDAPRTCRDNCCPAF